MYYYNIDLPATAYCYPNCNSGAWAPPATTAVRKTASLHYLSPAQTLSHYSLFYIYKSLSASLSISLINSLVIPLYHSTSSNFSSLFSLLQTQQPYTLTFSDTQHNTATKHWLSPSYDFSTPLSTTIFFLPQPTNCNNQQYSNSLCLARHTHQLQPLYTINTLQSITIISSPSPSRSLRLKLQATIKLFLFLLLCFSTSILITSPSSDLHHLFTLPIDPLFSLSSSKPKTTSFWPCQISRISLTNNLSLSSKSLLHQSLCTPSLHSLFSSSQSLHVLSLLNPSYLPLDCSPILLLFEPLLSHHWFTHNTPTININRTQTTTQDAQHELHN